VATLLEQVTIARTFSMVPSSTLAAINLLIGE